MPIPATACKLSHRGVLRLSGEERSTFLQALISNDTALCQPDKPLYAALLTPQGKFLHEFFVTNADDSFLIDCEKERADDLLQRLTTYKLRAKVTLANVSDTCDIWAFFYAVPLPHAGGARGGLGNTNTYLTSPPSVPPASGRDALTADPRLPALGSRGVFEANKTPAGFSVTDASLYDRHRLALGVTEGSRDLIIGKSTLLDGNFDFLNGISWTKGCYVGQELTARMHHRALVKKRIFPVKIEGTSPAPGSTITHNNTEIGEMRSSHGDVGLALLNIELVRSLIDKNSTVFSEGAQLTPYLPDWLSM